MSLDKTLRSKNHRRLSISIPDIQGTGGEQGTAKQSDNTEPKPKTTPAADSGPSLAATGDSAVSTPQGPPQQAQPSFPHVSSGSGTQTSTGQGSLANLSSTNVAEGPSVINKQLLSKLNKSLKEKQRIINNKTDSRNPALIQDIVTKLPIHASFPGNVSSEKGEKEKDEKGDSGGNEKGENGIDEHLHPPGHSRTEMPLLGLPPAGGKQEQDTKTKKRIAKQNSTRTEFFAAKLASAVDDVDTSDSDETFVYENSNNDFEANNNADNNNNTNNTTASGGVAGPVTLHIDDNDINKPPAGISLVQDNNISANASLRNPTPLGLMAHSPSVEARKELGEDHQNNNQQHTQAGATVPPRADLIHSVQSSKWNLRSTVGTSNTTPPSTIALRGQPQPPNVMSASGLGLGSNSEVHLFANPYIDQNKSANLKAGRKSSSNSLVNNEKPNVHPSPRYAASNQNFGLSLNSPGAPSVSEDRYSFEDGIIGDEVSYQCDTALVCTDFNNPAAQISEQAKADRNQRSSTTSLKLRSTTSKLFDKKGAQPRRYSIIPDDIDIEDFDDDLIYYDNNIRFPYNSQNGSHLNDSTSLLNNNHHRMTHYRSLNLSNPGNRQQPLNSKRYASMGFPSPTPGTRDASQGNNIYPFPYLDQKYYFDPENYDEEANMESADEVRSKSFFAGRGKLSPSNTHFRLPRKVSSERVGGGHVKCLKSFVYTMVSIMMILAIGFVLGFLLASTKDLSDLSIVSIEDALVSQDELLFQVVVEALNPGWFTISIEDVEIDIFAKSGYVKDPDQDSDTMDHSAVETFLLGTVNSFETTLDFQGSFFQRDYLQQTSEVKLVGPGRNLTGSIESALLLKGVGGYDETDTPPDNSEKWQVIRKNPFDLILRGVLKYKLPLSNTEKSATVNKVSYIDPNTPQGLV